MLKFRTSDGRVISTVEQEREWLESLIENDPAVRRDMARIFQRANRRIQNLEASLEAQRIGYSPALEAVLQYTGSAGGHFSKFHMVKNWDMMLEQTAQALAFMNEPTSTAGGARQWQREMTRGITDRFGDEIGEKDISRMMRAVYGAYGDDQFQQIAQRYVLSRTEMQVQESKGSMQQFIDAYVANVEAEKRATAEREAVKVDEAVNFIIQSFTKGGNIGTMFVPIR